MAIIRRLKDTFKFTNSHDERKRQQRLHGGRLLSAKKLLSLPSSHESDSNMTLNGLPVSFPPSATKEKKILNEGYDLRQSKLKNLVIDELKTYFISRNQNQQDQNGDRNSNTSLQTVPLTSKNFYFNQHIKQVKSTSSNKKITSQTVNPHQIVIDKSNY